MTAFLKRALGVKVVKPRLTYQELKAQKARR
jgi:hypothetical protein